MWPETLPQYWLGGTEEKRKASARIASVLAKI
jgi:hypothetical protein